MSSNLPSVQGQLSNLLIIDLKNQTQEMEIEISNNIAM